MLEGGTSRPLLGISSGHHHSEILQRNGLSSESDLRKRLVPTIPSSAWPSRDPLHSRSSRLNLAEGRLDLAGNRLGEAAVKLRREKSSVQPVVLDGEEDAQGSSR